MFLRFFHDTEIAPKTPRYTYWNFIKLKSRECIPHFVHVITFNWVLWRVTDRIVHILFRSEIHHFLEDSTHLAFCLMNSFEWIRSVYEISKCHFWRMRNDFIARTTVKRVANVIVFCETHEIYGLRRDKKVSIRCLERGNSIVTNHGQYSRLECGHLCVRLWPFESNNETIFLSPLFEVEVWLLRLPWSKWSENVKKKCCAFLQ